jgi:trigger factor
MHISVETMSGLERRLTISVPSQTFEGQITERLGNAAGQVKLPGFRPGKVPMKEVRRRYGPGVRAEVAGELMQSSFVDAVRSEDLSPAGSPNLEVVKMDPGIDFEFTATFEVFPAIAVTDLGRVQVQRPEAELSEIDIDEMVERLREQRKDWQSVDRGAADGDRVTLDFSGTMGDETFEGGSGEDVSFIVGAGQMIEDFDTGVTGLAGGADGEFQATFPDDYRVEDLGGKEATFKVSITEVAESKLPELDEEFFQAFGIEEGGADAFRADVKANMQREMDGTLNDLVKSQVMDQLNELHTVQLPKAMVGREIGVLKSQMLEQFQMYGAQSGTPPDLPELPDDMFQDQAERRVAVGLIVNQIVTEASIEPDPDKVRERVETMAEQYAEPQQVINYYNSNPEQLQQIEMAVLEDQVVGHILDKATLEILPSSYSDIIAGTALPSKEEDKEEDKEPDADPETSAGSGDDEAKTD